MPSEYTLRRDMDENLSYFGKSHEAHVIWDSRVCTFVYIKLSRTMCISICGGVAMRADRQVMNVGFETEGNICVTPRLFISVNIH